jgi:hypothetical protein
MPLQNPISKDLRKLLAFGSGVGVEIAGADLEVVAARVRLSHISVLGRLTIPNYAGRPAAEWGAEYSRFIKSLGVGHLSATVLLPRRDVIVRQVMLPGVAPKDIESAVRFQLDTLHPYGDDEVSCGWSALPYGAVLVGIVRRATVDRYYQLFNEAGMAVSSFTFSAAAVHAAIRLNGAASGPGFIALSRSAAGAVEVYGESQSRPVFSAEFDLAPERATILALSELRLPPDTAPLRLEAVLPKPDVNPVANDLSRNALPYATALAGACPRFAPSANVLPAEHRRFSSRAAVGAAVYSSYADRKYLRKLEAEIAVYEPQAQRVATVDREMSDMQARSRVLDQFRQQTRRDLDALNELTRLVEPPAWVNSTTLTRDSARITGEAPQAPPLLKILDSSPLFEGSTADSILRSQSGAGETFMIHMNRRAGK